MSLVGGGGVWSVSSILLVRLPGLKRKLLLIIPLNIGDRNHVPALRWERQTYIMCGNSAKRH